MVMTMTVMVVNNAVKINNGDGSTAAAAKTAYCINDNARKPDDEDKDVSLW